MKNSIILVLIVILAVLGFAWTKQLQKNSGEIVSHNGLHWHPELTMYVRGEKIEIPPNVGLGTIHQPIHTHDDMPILHLEFTGMVRSNDLKLGNFFTTWGKDMRSFGSNMKMYVNGEESMEYGNYILKDKDKIELRYD